MSAMQRTPAATHKLQDFLGKDLAGFRLAKGYLLELVHSSMGFFPALIASTGEVVVCLDRDMLEEVRKTLPDRRSSVRELLLLVNDNGCFGFDIRNQHSDPESLHILTLGEFQTKTQEAQPFLWSPGLIS